VTQRSWYGAKCLFEHLDLSEEPGRTVYEERVVLIRATDWDDAIARSEADAARYAGELPGVRYLGFMDGYHIGPVPRITEGTEVYSLMRESALAGKDYLDRYCDDGTERRQAWRSPTKAADSRLPE
jgi:hypothetical protein